MKIKKFEAYNGTMVVPVYLKDDKQQIVNARELHEYLGVKDVFPTWISRRINKYEFKDGEDYTVLLYLKNKYVGEQGKVDLTSKTANLDTQYIKKEYAITIDMAKELAMVQNNERGKEARKYFIAVEKTFREMVTPKLPVTFAEALRELADVVEQIEEQKPKIKSFEQFIDSSELTSMSEAAKLLKLGYGRNILFKNLREMNILRKNNEPYQQYINSGYFEIKTTHTYKDKRTTVTFVTSKGLEYLRKKLKTA